MKGMDNMALETEVQSLSISRNRDSSVMLISMLHIASNVNCTLDIVKRLDTVQLLLSCNRYFIWQARFPIIIHD